MPLQTLAERVRYILDAQHISLTQAAAYVGCSREAISQWATGATKNIRNEWLFRFADYTGYDARWIATGAGPMRQLDKYCVENIRHVVQVMETMPPYMQQVARKLVDDVKDIAAPGQRENGGER